MKATIAVTMVILAQAAYSADITLDYGGGKVVLHDDHTWEWAPTSTNRTDFISLSKLDTQSGRLVSARKKYTIYFDPVKWMQTKPSSSAAEFGFENAEATGYGMAVFDGLSIPLESMEKVMIQNASKIDPNARILEVQQCVVNGTAGELVTYTATGSGIDITYFYFVATGGFGTVQYTFYTTSAEFPRLKQSFLDGIAGIVFQEE